MLNWAQPAKSFTVFNWDRNSKELHQSNIPFLIFLLRFFILWTLVLFCCHSTHSNMYSDVSTYFLEYIRNCLSNILHIGFLRKRILKTVFFRKFVRKVLSFVWKKNLQKSDLSSIWSYFLFWAMRQVWSSRMLNCRGK